MSVLKSLVARGRSCQSHQPLTDYLSALNTCLTFLLGHCYKTLYDVYRYKMPLSPSLSCIIITFKVGTITKMEDQDNVQNMEDGDEDDVRGFEWDAGREDRDFEWLEDDEEEEMFVSSRSPAERSGHIAVTDGSFMFVWGGYKVSQSHITSNCTQIWNLTFLMFLNVCDFIRMVMLKLLNLLICTCQRLKSGYTTWRQEDGKLTLDVTWG